MLKYFEIFLGHVFRLHVNTCLEEAFLLVSHYTKKLNFDLNTMPS